MPSHSYSEREALETILKKLTEWDETIAGQIRAVIDVGKDVEETEPLFGGRQRKSRVYRKTVPFTEAEALAIVLKALQSHFVEQPEFINSANENFKLAAIGSPKDTSDMWMHSQASKDGRPEPVDLTGQDSPKAMQIETKTETQISDATDEVFLLKMESDDTLARAKAEVEHLAELLKF